MERERERKRECEREREREKGREVHAGMDTEQAAGCQATAGSSKKPAAVLILGAPSCAAAAICKLLGLKYVIIGNRRAAAQ